MGEECVENRNDVSFVRKVDYTKDAFKLLEENYYSCSSHEARYGRMWQEINQYPQPIYMHALINIQCWPKKNNTQLKDNFLT